MTETQAVEAVQSVTAQPHASVGNEAREALSNLFANVADANLATLFGLVERTAYTTADREAGNSLLPLAVVRGNTGAELILFSDNSNGGDHSVDRANLEKIVRLAGGSDLIPEADRQKFEEIETAKQKYATGDFVEASTAAAFLSRNNVTNFNFGNNEYRIRTDNYTDTNKYKTYSRTFYIESRNIGQQSWQMDSGFHQYRDETRGFALLPNSSFRTKSGEARHEQANQITKAPEGVLSYRKAPINVDYTLPNVTITNDQLEPVLTLPEPAKETPVVHHKEAQKPKATWILQDLPVPKINLGPYTSDDRKMEEAFSAFYKRNVFALFSGNPEQVNSITLADVRRFMANNRADPDRASYNAGWELESTNVFNKVANLHDDNDGGQAITMNDVRAGKRQLEDKRLAADPDFQFIRGLFRPASLADGAPQSAFDFLMHNPRVKRTGQISYENLEQTIQGMNANDPRKAALAELQNKWYWFNSSGFKKYLHLDEKGTNSMISGHLNYFLTPESLVRGLNIGIEQGQNPLDVLRQRTTQLPNKVEDQIRYENIQSLTTNVDFNAFRSLFSEEQPGTSIFNRILDAAKRNGRENKISLGDVEQMAKELDEQKFGKEKRALLEIAKRWRAGVTPAFNGFGNFLDTNWDSSFWDFSAERYFMTPASVARGLGVFIRQGEEPLAAMREMARTVPIHYSFRP